jgi:3'(2'), 5'-bisphosphate nucleotidase
MPADLDDHALAADLARRAGALLLELRAAAGDTSYDWWALQDEGDLSSHRFLAKALAEARPGDKVLSEEGMEDPSRIGADRVWIVDPLDGTREFGERGRPDWAVHVALVTDSAPVAGAVALPAMEMTLSTAEPPVVPAAKFPRPRVVVSRSRPPAVAIRVAEALDGELVAMGSAGAKAMAVVLGEADVYCHAGGQYEWDSAAPVAVALAAGLHATRIDGSPLLYNKPDPWQPDLLICRPELAATSLAAIAAHAGWT